MTAIALQSLNFSGKLLSTLWKGTKKTLQGIMIGWIIARQTQANQHIARQLVDSGEYRRDEYWNLLHKLNAECISSIHKEFKV
jgi:hypothetical protein